MFAVEPPYSYNNPQAATSGGGGSGVGGSVSSPFASAPTSSASLRFQHSMGSVSASTTATSAVNNNSSNIVTNNSSGSGSGNSNNGGPSAGAAAASDLDPQAYAGRSDASGNVDLVAGESRAFTSCGVWFRSFRYQLSSELICLFLLMHELAPITTYFLLPHFVRPMRAVLQLFYC